MAHLTEPVCEEAEIINQINAIEDPWLRGEIFSHFIGTNEAVTAFLQQRKTGLQDLIEWIKSL